MPTHLQHQDPLATAREAYGMLLPALEEDEGFPGAAAPEELADTDMDEAMAGRPALGAAVLLLAGWDEDAVGLLEARSLDTDSHPAAVVVPFLLIGASTAVPTARLIAKGRLGRRRYG